MKFISRAGTKHLVATAYHHVAMNRLTGVSGLRRGIM